MRAALRHMLVMTQGSDNSVFETGDFRMDIMRRQVFVGEEEIHLTPIEYKLLLMLVQNAGKVVTQRQLLHDVWGPG
jgi:two-component system KDP operon response regulator KdpE